jgi:hypothetical protein
MSIRSFLLAICFLLLNCNSKTIHESLNFKDVEYYEDINFDTFEGVRPVKKDEKNAFIEIISNNGHEVELKIYSKINSKSYSTYREIFEKEKDYYYQFKEEKDDNPNILLKTYVYIKKDNILIYSLSTNKGEPNYSTIKEIVPSKNEITELELDGALLEPKPYANFDILRKSPNIFSITKKTLKIKDKLLVVEGEIEKFRENKIERYFSHYEGFPDLKINSYWNLYRFFLGKDIR